VFRRSRGKDAGRPRRDPAQLDEAEPELDDEDGLDEAEPGDGRHSGPDLGDPDTWTRLRAPGRGAAADPRAEGGGGPWDAADSYPETSRIDLAASRCRSARAPTSR
jgi:hypothetical protein